jgi:hypothetical protein
MAAFIDENTQFVDTNGKPIVNGKLYIGTKGLDPVTNAITIYSDRALTVVIDNPQLLDSAGRSTNKIWIPALYSFRVDNTNDVQQLQDLDAGDIQPTGTTILFDIQGTNSITGIASPTIESYVDGQIYVFQPANDNTGATTLNIDSIGAKAIVLTALPIGTGTLIAGLNYTVAYNQDNNNFDLLGAPGGGATGGGGDKVFYENSQNVTVDYTITNGQNAMSAGPVTIDSGITVTVGPGEVWVVV